MAYHYPLSPIQVENWMSRLIKRGEESGSKGEIPVSAVVIDKKGLCIGRGSNCREQGSNPLGHAELIAIRQAAYINSDWRLNNCTLIVTLEPCTMCAGAIIQARIGKVIFAASDPKRGGLGGSIDLSKHPSAHHKMIIQKGILEAEAEVQLKSWFKENLRSIA